MCGVDVRVCPLESGAGIHLQIILAKPGADISKKKPIGSGAPFIFLFTFPLKSLVSRFFPLKSSLSLHFFSEIFTYSLLFN